MSTSNEIDYVLGTHDAEIGRLHLQHGIWRELVHDCWQRADISKGQRIIDIGCGPGFASVDLADVVGSDGDVIGIERSERFIGYAKGLCKARGLNTISFLQADVMLDELPAYNADAIWCRWLSIFVSDPALLVQKMAAMVKPGGKLIFHEYVHYETYQSIPHSQHLEEFVQHVMHSWRGFGGEPNVARFLPDHLTKAGCRILDTRPISFSAQPHQPVWQWPASFIDINLQRMLELGEVNQQWADVLRSDFAALQSNPNAILITPMVLEIIAEKI
ncbi:MAG TPA: methyltransferase domain-containing protein [Arenimonas sp.]|nr:methyltransferase domain-containing protein [Arenimonas sp.]